MSSWDPNKLMLVIKHILGYRALISPKFTNEPDKAIVNNIIMQIAIRNAKGSQKKQRKKIKKEVVKWVENWSTVTFVENYIEPTHQLHVTKWDTQHLPTWNSEKCCGCSSQMPMTLRILECMNSVVIGLISNMSDYISLIPKFRCVSILNYFSKMKSYSLYYNSLLTCYRSLFITRCSHASFPLPTQHMHKERGYCSVRVYLSSIQHKKT